MKAIMLNFFFSGIHGLNKLYKKLKGYIRQNCFFLSCPNVDYFFS